MNSNGLQLMKGRLAKEYQTLDHIVYLNVKKLNTSTLYAEFRDIYNRKDREKMEMPGRTSSCCLSRWPVQRVFVFECIFVLT